MQVAFWMHPACTSQNFEAVVVLAGFGNVQPHLYFLLSMLHFGKMSSEGQTPSPGSVTSRVLPTLSPHQTKEGEFLQCHGLPEDKMQKERV